MHPHVSIIIPVHNAEPFLTRCLDSAAAQTEPNVEIICVDDASTDASPAMLDARAREDKRFRVVHRKTNGGESVARNQGVAMARGEYLAFLDHDDMLEPDACRMLYQTAKRTGADITKGRAHIVTYDGKIIEDSFQKHENIATLSKFCFTYHWWTAIYKTKLARKISFDERYRIGGDGLFLNNILVDATIVAVINNFVYTHFQLYTSNGSYVLDDDKIVQYINIWKFMIDYLHIRKVHVLDKNGYIYKIVDLFFSCIQIFDKSVHKKKPLNIVQFIFYIYKKTYYKDIFISKIHSLLPKKYINFLLNDDIDSFYKSIGSTPVFLRISIVHSLRQKTKLSIKA